MHSTVAFCYTRDKFVLQHFRFLANVMQGHADNKQSRKSGFVMYFNSSLSLKHKKQNININIYSFLYKSVYIF